MDGWMDGWIDGWMDGWMGRKPKKKLVRLASELPQAEIELIQAKAGDNLLRREWLRDDPPNYRGPNAQKLHSRLRNLLPC